MLCLAPLSACAWQSDGASVAVAYRTAAETGEALADGTVVLYSLTIDRCDQRTARQAPPTLRERVREALLPSAWAHGEAAPNRFAVPVALAIHSDEYRSSTVLQPARGEYCGVTVLFAPADVDTYRLALSPGILGRTIQLSAFSDDGTEHIVISEEHTEFQILFSEPISIDSDTSLEILVHLDFRPLVSWLRSAGKHALANDGATPVLAMAPPAFEVTAVREALR
jgi:hypothetical protein